MVFIRKVRKYLYPLWKSPEEKCPSPFQLPLVQCDLTVARNHLIIKLSETKHHSLKEGPAVDQPEHGSQDRCIVFEW